jgi:misacylated tRNA(Ala) deacylase
MTKALYLEDSYMREFEAKIVSVERGKFIVLNQTAFYPKSGGQPNDIGILVRKIDGMVFKVVFVGKFSGEISHELESDGSMLNVGDLVVGKINWERRYAHMRMHTAAHILAEALYRNCSSLTTGNQLGAEESRIDSNFVYSPDLVEKTFKDANAAIQQDLAVTSEVMTRDEAEKLPKMTKLAKGLPSEIKEVRVLKVGDYDMQADCGTHVKSTKEIGKIEFVRYNSKGKDNKRIYFKLVL